MTEAPEPANIFICRSTSRVIQGCVIAFRHSVRSWEENARLASRERFKVPSARRISLPNSPANSCKQGVPGCTTMRATWSASTTCAPHSTAARAAVLFPEPVGPVSPNRKGLTNVQHLKSRSSNQPVIYRHANPLGGRAPGIYYLSPYLIQAAQGVK